MAGQSTWPPAQRVGRPADSAGRRAPRRARMVPAIATAGSPGVTTATHAGASRSASAASASRSIAEQRGDLGVRPARQQRRVPARGAPPHTGAPRSRVPHRAGSSGRRVPARPGTGRICAPRCVRSFSGNGCTTRRGLFLLFPTDVTWVANRLSCDQDIAADGFFSLGMMARFESLPAASRRLVLSAALLGMRADWAGALSRSRSCRRSRHRHRLLLRRPGARGAGPLGPRVAEPLPLLVGVPVDDTGSRRRPGYEWEKEDG